MCSLTKLIRYFIYDLTPAQARGALFIIYSGWKLNKMTNELVADKMDANTGLKIFLFCASRYVWSDRCSKPVFAHLRNALEVYHSGHCGTLAFGWPILYYIYSVFIHTNFFVENLFSKITFDLYSSSLISLLSTFSYYNNRFGGPTDRKILGLY